MSKGKSKPKPNGGTRGKPAHGPGTDGPVWCRTTNKWTLPLNAHGRAVAEAFMAKYRMKPEASIAGFDGGRYRVHGKKVFADATALLGEGETHSVACEAVVRAAANYDPTQFGCGEDGFTYVVMNIYLRLKRAVEVFRDRAAKAREVQPPPAYDRDSEVDVLDHAEGFADDPAEAEEWADFRRLLDDKGRFLPPRERALLVCRYRYGWTLLEVADRLGVTRERVRQMEVHALTRMRVMLEKAGVNRHTLADGSTLPPPRSQRCLRRNARAATR